MSIVFGLAIYFMIWWIVLFAALPFGSKRTQQEAGEVTPGTEPGAPEKPEFVKVIVMTTIIATLLFGALVWFRNSGLTLDDLPLPRPPSKSYDAAS
ncbi:DUF1467 family protein [Roseibium limicola]|uniref:DUF1467 family protein n=1 Tax=Roseibium limicola TaxID=2816037 RepID=A0A939EP41_9HYPH|nr:DUF1467 family protein [Roseibium limicola]MBO0344539.1 DUF1467 family protein [Roseibium limicola]